MSSNTRPAVAPVLSTPETHIFEAPTIDSQEQLEYAEILERYEVERTAREICAGKWKRVALQFEDSMLPHAVKVYEALQLALISSERDADVGLSETEKSATLPPNNGDGLEAQLNGVKLPSNNSNSQVKLFILADTSYGSCCVDEIAAEHVDAEVVVHYGRSCLSPTNRLPVIYVFTIQPLDVEALMDSFQKTYLEKGTGIIVMADVPYISKQSRFIERLREMRYTNVINTSIIHNPSSPLPNRILSPDITGSDNEILKNYSVFHIGHPPKALLLTLASRVGSVQIYDPHHASSSAEVQQRAAKMTLRRRYALVTSLASVSIFGILVNTLSVANYQHMAALVAKQIARAGKKSYTFVVGKVNAAKVANFAEIGGWVVIGCWESSLVESDEFYKPLVTPFELEIALQGESRIWTGEWKSDFTSILEAEQNKVSIKTEGKHAEEGINASTDDFSDEEDSEPPQFDFKTGRYVSHTRPMKPPRKSTTHISKQDDPSTTTIMKRGTGELAQINGQASPGAEFLRQQRTWQGLGSDFATDFTGEEAVVEEGRSGVAKGYVVGDQQNPR